MRTNTHPVIIALLLILILFCFSAQSQAQNTPPHNASTDCGQTLNFNGSNNYVSVPYTSATNSTSTSVSVWAYVKGYTGNFQAIACSRNAGPLVGWTIYIEPGTNQYLLMAGIEGDQWNTTTTTEQVQLNTWTHLVITMSGTDAKLFVNGTAYPLTLAANYKPNAAAEMRIGAGATDSYPQVFFDGQLDEFTLWNRALNETEVANLYAGNDIDNTGLEAYYDFNEEMTTATLIDRTGHGHDGTLHNMDASTAWQQADGSTSTLTTWYADLDNDGYAGALTWCANSSPGTGYSLTNPTSHTEIDCDDHNPNVNPGKTEIPYNGIDDDCNPLTSVPFVTKWKITSAGESITIPTSVSYGLGYTYSYSVDWGDGVADNTVYNDDATHTYTNAGTYSVSIIGQFPHLDFGDWIDNYFNGNNAPPIISVENWGEIHWNSMYFTFGNVVNLAINATDVPDLSQVTDMSYMFNRTLLSSDINGVSTWDVSHVTDMDYMFQGSNFNQSIGNWNISSVNSMNDMLDQSNMSITNYDNTLIGWAAQSNVPSNLTLGAYGLHYCNVSARNMLINTNGWSIQNDINAAGLIIPNASALRDVYSTTPVTSLTAPTATSCTDGQLTGTTNVVFPITQPVMVTWTYSDSDPNTDDVHQQQFIFVGTQRPFVTKWQTTSAGESITIPTSVNYGYGFSYSYTVDWGDGTVDNNVYTNDATHAYTDAGTYSVSITGQFPHLDFNDWINYSGSAPQIVSVEQWGDIHWGSMSRTFAQLSGTPNPLAFNATDAPDLSAVTDMSGTFSNSSFNGDISKWDVSTVTNMSQMFYHSSFASDISQWNVSNVTSMNYMFYRSAFTGDISQWDVSHVTDMSMMFYRSSFNNDISQWNVSGVTNMRYMFVQSSFVGDISQWDVSHVTNMSLMFYASSFNGDISQWNVSQVTNMYYMFYSSPFNVDLSNWDIGNVTNMQNMFNSSLLSKTNYEKTLQGWATLGANETQIPSGISLGAGGLHYCDDTFRNQLINDHGWSIAGDTQDCTLTLTGTDNQQVDVNVAVAFTVSPTYSGTGTLTYSLDNVSLAKGMSINATTGAFSWTPTQAQIGKNYLTITVTDGSTYDRETVVITVNKLDQTVTFDALAAKTFGDVPFDLSATSSSGLAVKYTSSNADVVTISGSTVTIIGAGETTITALQPGDHTYNQASADQLLTVNKAPQTITFGALPTKTFGDAPFDLTATASSGLPVTFTSSNTAVAAISGSTVTIVGAGETIITASQSGNNYVDASVPQTLTVNKADQAITFTSIADHTLGDAAFTLAGTINSGLSISYSSSDASLASINGSAITLLKAGHVTITASQNGDGNHNAAASVAQGFCINPLKPTISLSGENTASTTLTSSSSSGNQWYKNGTSISGATNTTYLINDAGKYTVQVTVGTCSSQISNDQIIVITEITEKNADINVYPTIVKDFVNIKLPDNTRAVMVIHDLNGRTLMSQQLLEKVSQVNVSSFSQGMYLLRITDSQSQQPLTFKFIKE